jgi:hypothetical protein
MSQHHFTNYRCVLALDPDEWPGEWQGLLDDFPALASQRMKCWEDARESSLVGVGPDEELIDEVLRFLEAVRVRQMPPPNGGVVFLDASGQAFKTNWELRECWDWRYVLRRIERDQVFQQCFPSSGAIIEVERLASGVRLQHIDYEHPLGVAGSRLDLAGVILEDVGHFKVGLHHTLSYLHAVAERATRIGRSEAFESAFGVAPQDDQGDAG